jgi:hypothetical protein
VSDITNLLGALGAYYSGKSGQEGAMAAGKLGMDMSSDLASDLETKTEFKPFTVTGRTGTSITSPDGSVDLRMNPQQAGLSNTLFTDASNIFNKLRYDTDGVQTRADKIYGDIRATQTPEEQRQRLAMEERLLGQGRLGLQSSMFGGANPEMFALEQARQEAMSKAALDARTMAGQERQADYALASGLMGQSYVPENQMMSLLGAGIAPKQLQQDAQQTQAQLWGQMEGRGVESFLQGSDLANRLELQQQQAMMDAFMPQAPSMEDILRAKALGIDPATLGGDAGLWSALGFGDAETPSWIKNIGDDALRWLGLGGDDDEEEVVARDVDWE